MDKPAVDISQFQYAGPLPTFAASSGPKAQPRIALVGEAWGQQEELVKQPFIGAAGQELNRLLQEAGIKRSECFATNVFALRPPSNNIKLLCAKKAEVGKGYKAPMLAQGSYVRPEFFPEIDRLRHEIETVNPNLVVCLGAVASWAIINSARIGALRGAVCEALLVPRLKVLPTYHPSAVLRNWSLRTIVLADLMKAERESHFAAIRRPQRFVLVRPTLDEICEWYNTHAIHASHIAIDIETKRGQIKNIGFAVSRTHAINIKFVDDSGADFWPDHQSEVLAWKWVKLFCKLPAKKIFQNGLYDLQFLWRMGIVVHHCTEDTMLQHHALYPELQKGLGFLGSIYTSEPAWKLMRTAKTDMLKRDDE